MGWVANSFSLFALAMWNAQDGDWWMFSFCLLGMAASIANAFHALRKRERAS